MAKEQKRREAPDLEIGRLAHARRGFEQTMELVAAQQTERLTWSIALILSVLAAVPTLIGSAQEVADPRVEFVGSYSQFRQTPEHVYGYAFELWRDGGSLVGRWSRAQGQQSDFPTVLVTDLRLNPANGALHFTATWCGSEVETFAGVLTDRAARGTVTRRWSIGRATQTKVVAEKSKVVLVRSTGAAELFGDMARDAWKAWLSAKIKRHGRKC